MTVTSRARWAGALWLVAMWFAASPLAGQSSTGAGVARTADGRPDLSGVWQVLNTAAWDLQDHSAQPGIPAGQGVVDGNEIPYQSWAAEKKKANFANRATADPESKCYLPGVPRLTYMPYPLQIVQAPKDVIVLSEYAHAVRTIHMDGRPHPTEAVESWLGDSRGRWDGDTLVVDVTHFNGKTWFDRAGNFHSDALHVTERYTPAGPDHIDYVVTIEDAKVFTRPWTMRMTLYRRKEKNVQLLEYECYGFAHEKLYP
jgi:hypothetical protein